MTGALDTRVTRRHFAVTAGVAFASVAFGKACLVSTKSAEGTDGQLTVRPRPDVATALESGPLGLGDGRLDGGIQMPSAVPEGKVPLLVFLHGATQSGAAMLRRVGPAADR